MTYISIAKIVVTVAVLVNMVPGQLAPREQAQIQFTKWQNRVDDLSKEIVNESSSVPDTDRSLYLALLAKIWWEVNETEARTHLKAAISKMLSGLRSGERIDLPKKIKVAQRTIEIVTKLDDKLGQDLIAQVVAAVDESNDGPNRKENPELAELYVNLGLQVVKKRPELALSCGINSLDHGVAGTLPGLIAQLNVQDPAKAQILYRRALSRVHGNYSSSRLLFLVNFTKYLFNVWGDFAFSDPIRKEFLGVFSEMLAAAAMVEFERPSRCRIAIYGPVALPLVDEYLPNQSLPFRQNMQICIPYIAGSQQELVRVPTTVDQPKTVDEFVSAAKDTRDLELKIRFWRAALTRLESEKKYPQMISLLDGIDGDDLKTVAPIVWDDWRIGAAFQFAMESFEADDLPAAYRAVEKTPKSIRLEVRMQIAKKLKPSANNPFYSENIDEMQKELGSIDKAPKDVVRYYRTLADLYLKLRPTESEAMFRHAVKYINKADNDNPDFLNDKDWAPMLDYVPVSAELLDLDETSITSSLNNLNLRRSRVRLKLGLLESSLKKYVAAKETLDELTKLKKS